jgi:transcriptional regulator with XRE-family HTH domain
VSAGHELQRLRKARGLSQQDLAVAIGMTAAAVTQWETGKITPRRSTAALIDAALGTDDQVLALFGYATPAAAGDELTRRIDALERSNARLEGEVRSLARLVKELGRRAERDAERRTRQARRATPPAADTARSRQ